MTNKPKVTTACVANKHTGPNERIVEFSCGQSANGDVRGELINFFLRDDGTLTVCVYRTDPSVIVQVGVDAKYHLPLDSDCVGTSPRIDGDLRPAEVERVKKMLRLLPQDLLRAALREGDEFPDDQACPECGGRGTPEHDHGAHTIFRCRNDGCTYEDSWEVDRLPDEP